MSFEFALVFGIIIAVLFVIIWANYYKNESKTTSGTIRCSGKLKLDSSQPQTEQAVVLL